MMMMMMMMMTAMILMMMMCMIMNMIMIMILIMIFMIIMMIMMIMIITSGLIMDNASNARNGGLELTGAARLVKDFWHCTGCLEHAQQLVFKDIVEAIPWLQALFVAI